MARPIAPARMAVELAVRALPDLDDRLRHRAEFTADLATLRPTAQLRHAAGVLSQIFALRTALAASPTRAEEDAMTVSRSAEDGTRFVACSRCGKEKGPNATNAMMGAGG